MISESLTKALSEQFNAEYYSAYLYEAMSAYADRAGFRGIAHWLYVQAREELEHGTKIFKYLLERGAAPEFSDIKTPPVTFGGIREVFEKVLAHERSVTARINKIADLAASEKDHAAYHFILWYVNEQVEEEADSEDVVNKVTAAGNNAGLLYQLDALMGARS
ncbi:MAG: ferritin [Treponema sp.]|jgi:ferritin|nr:ferritin [Treponema sp.]